MPLYVLPGHWFYGYAEGDETPVRLLVLAVAELAGRTLVISNGRATGRFLTLE